MTKTKEETVRENVTIEIDNDNSGAAFKFPATKESNATTFLVDSDNVIDNALAVEVEEGTEVSVLFPKGAWAQVGPNGEIVVNFFSDKSQCITIAPFFVA